MACTSSLRILSAHTSLCRVFAGVGADYYFDYERMVRAFPRLRASVVLRHAFPQAAHWPPKPPTPLMFVQLAAGERLCEEVVDGARLEALGVFAQPDSNPQ